MCCRPAFVLRWFSGQRLLRGSSRLQQTCCTRYTYPSPPLRSDSGSASPSNAPHTPFGLPHTPHTVPGPLPASALCGVCACWHYWFCNASCRHTAAGSTEHRPTVSTRVHAMRALRQLVIGSWEQRYCCGRSGRRGNCHGRRTEMSFRITRVVMEQAARETHNHFWMYMYGLFTPCGHPQGKKAGTRYCPLRKIC